MIWPSWNNFSIYFWCDWGKPRRQPFGVPTGIQNGYLPKIILDLYIHFTVNHNRFLFNNQPAPLIIQILICHKSLQVSGIFCAHHQEFYTLHSALVSFMQVFGVRFQGESGWNCSSILTLTLTSAECTVQNFWWWAEKMPETCWILLQNKI